MTKDFLAIWFNSFGSSYARYNNKETAVLECAKLVVRDWGSTFEIEGNPITISVFDASGFKEIQWDHGTVWADDDKRIDLYEAGRHEGHHTVITPKLRKNGDVYQPSFLKKLQFAVQNASVDYYKGKELDKQTKTLAA